MLPEETWGETQHGLRKRTALLAQRGSLSEARAAQLLADTLAIIAARVTPATPELYADRLTEAQRRVPHDPRDVPDMALALTLACGIWTADQDFFGCGLPVWTTETLLLHLTPAPSNMSSANAGQTKVSEVAYVAFTQLGDHPATGWEVVVRGNPGESKESVEARARERIATDDLWGAVGNLVSDPEGRASPDPGQDRRNVLHEKEFLIVISEAEAGNDPRYRKALEDDRRWGGGAI